MHMLYDVIILSIKTKRTVLPKMACGLKSELAKNNSVTNNLFLKCCEVLQL